ncbi:hypothetical protein [Acinetobacter pittii]|uniref:hypothetical protein n=1 Tax=Acinetobacter pittii TaxID=48296 RepID=UPI001D073265|nr:hypothetical protein [Acinetobacter pittii]
MMSKLSFYTASFPSDFTKLADFFEKKSAKNNESITLIKKRTDYLELKYFHNKIIIEEYYDTNNVKKTIERLSTKEVIFRIYNKNKFNFIIINQPRSILDLKNYLSKLFLFEFFISKEILNLNKLIESLGDKIDYIFRVELREALYPNNIFSKHIFYTQNKSLNQLEPFTSLLKTKHYSIFKIELYFKDFLNIKFIITNDAHFSLVGLGDEEAIQFISKTLTLAL